MCRLIDDHEIVAAVSGEVSRDQADRLRERTDDRSAGGRVQAVQARAGAESQRLAEGVRGIVEEDGHVARGLVAHDDVRQTIAVHVGHRDVRRRDAGGQRDRSRELPWRSLQGDGDAVVQSVGGDQVVKPVSGQVGGGEAAWAGPWSRRRVRAR